MFLPRYNEKGHVTYFRPTQFWAGAELERSVIVALFLSHLELPIPVCGKSALPCGLGAPM